MGYADELREPEWQARRLAILRRDGFSCRNCSAMDRHLHVHHLTYFAGRMPWEYEDVYLLTLCAECHAAAHSLGN